MYFNNAETINSTNWLLGYQSTGQNQYCWTGY